MRVLTVLSDQFTYCQVEHSVVLNIFHNALFMVMLVIDVPINTTL